MGAALFVVRVWCRLSARQLTAAAEPVRRQRQEPAAPHPFHSESLTDGASNFIFASGDVVTVVGVPN